MTGNYFSQTAGDATAKWPVEVLWAAAIGLPVVECLIAELVAVEELQALLTREPQRVEAADTSFPIILSPHGHIADGYHRCARRYRDGYTTVLACQLLKLPPPSDVYRNYDVVVGGDTVLTAPPPFRTVVTRLVMEQQKEQNDANASGKEI